jgi:hypothetical protein
MPAKYFSHGVSLLFLLVYAIVLARSLGWPQWVAWFETS